MPTIFIDNKPYEVKEGQNLLHAAISRGLDLPYFCWHPALGSIGACRQCAVQHYKDEADTTGRTVMACMTPCGDNNRFSVNNKIAVDFRSHVIEWMMTNHPHDCPVCDEGGECHLQDMTVMTKHNYRRFRFKKRTFKNQYLGPFINHEMNRCITCYRCVRFYQGVAGGSDLSAFSLSNRVYFGRMEDGTLENEFSGNLAEVCPTGVFTDKPYKETYTRKWDLQCAPSICQLCSLGCNILPGERYGSIRRVQNRYNPFVNGYFICDRGRFGHSFVNSVERITAPSTFIAPFKQGVQAIGIGSPRASLEVNFALREAVGSQNFYLGLKDSELALYQKVLSIIKNGPAKTASLHDIEKADALFILGEDVTNTAPMIALQIRKGAYDNDANKAHALGIPSWNDQAVRNLAQELKAPLYTATVTKTKLDTLANRSFHADPDSLALLGYEIAHHINGAAPGPKTSEPSLALEIAAFLKSAHRPVIIAGAGLQHSSLIEAAANIAFTLCAEGIDARMCLTLPEANSLGLTLLGDQNLSDALARVRKDSIDAMVIVENDISQRLSDEDFDEFFARVPQVIAVDYLKNKTSTKAHVLPALPFSEITGTLINNEGRAQRYYSVFAPKNPLAPTWATIGDLFHQKWQNLDHLTNAMCDSIAELKPFKDHVATANLRLLEQKIPRQTLEWSGRTANTANIQISEAAPPHDPNSPLCHSMEGFSGHPPAELTPFFWAPGWNSVQALNKYLKDVDGDYKNDHVGVRLFEGNANKAPVYYNSATTSLSLKKGQLRVIPWHFIFGSEERAPYAKALSERITKAHIGLSMEDAKLFNVSTNDHISFAMAGKKHILPVYIDANLAPHFALIPVGLNEFGLWLPKTCEIQVLEALV